MSDNNFELQTENNSTHSQERLANSTSQPDGGWKANVILIGCCGLQFPVWGQCVNEFLLNSINLPQAL